MASGVSAIGLPEAKSIYSQSWLPTTPEISQNPLPLRGSISVRFPSNGNRLPVYSHNHTLSLLPRSLTLHAGSRRKSCIPNFSSCDPFLRLTQEMQLNDPEVVRCADFSAHISPLEATVWGSVLQLWMNGLHHLFSVLRIYRKDRRFYLPAHHLSMIKAGKLHRSLSPLVSNVDKSHRFSYHTVIVGH